MTSIVCNACKSFSHQLQLDECGYSFIGGAALGLAISGGNPVFGLVGGVTSTIAYGVNVFAQAVFLAFKNHNNSSNYRFYSLTRNEILVTKVVCLTAVLGGLNLIGFPISFGGSLLVSLPFIFIDYARSKR